MIKALFIALLATYVFAQNCSSIYSSGNPQYYYSLSVSMLPSVSNQLPTSACANNGYVLEGSCTYEEYFSCLIFADNTFWPVDCKRAQEKGLFPICYGQVQFFADCETVECCQALNEAALPYVQQKFGTIYDTSYYYWMQFYASSLNGYEISCPSTRGPIQCVQNLNFYASSNWETCNTFYKNFQNADAMAFNLF